MPPGLSQSPRRTPWPGTQRRLHCTLTLLNLRCSGFSFLPLFIRLTCPSPFFFWATLKDNSQERQLKPYPSIFRFIRKTWELGIRIIQKRKIQHKENSSCPLAKRFGFLEYIMELALCNRAFKVSSLGWLKHSNKHTHTQTYTYTHTIPMPGVGTLKRILFAFYCI